MGSLRPGIVDDLFGLVPGLGARWIESPLSASLGERGGSAWSIRAPLAEPMRVRPLTVGAETMPGDRLMRILDLLGAGGDTDAGPARLCEVCAEAVVMTGAGVMLMSGDMPSGSVCSSNEVSALIEDLQYTLGEGPCVDAYHQDRPVLEPDLADPDVAPLGRVQRPCRRRGGPGGVRFPDAGRRRPPRRPQLATATTPDR